LLYRHSPFVLHSPSQSAIGTVESVLTGAGAVSFLGPTLLNSTNTSSSTTNTVQTGLMVTGTSVTTTVYIGPVTINIGDLGVCQSYPPLTGCTGGTPFALSAGQTDYDTLTVTLVDILTTTTTTDLLTQVYDLVGVPVAAPVPEPPAWTLLGAGLLDVGCIFRQRIKDRAHLPSQGAAS
jgi:hypothetical protein